VGNRPAISVPRLTEREVDWGVRGAAAALIATSVTKWFDRRPETRNFVTLVAIMMLRGLRSPPTYHGQSPDPRDGRLAGAAADGIYLTCPCDDANTDRRRAHSPRPYRSTKRRGQSVATAFGKVDYKSVRRPVTFQPTGEPGGEHIFIYQVRGGKISVLGGGAKLSRG
jgi:hypothetical protein